ncbi:MAG: hypothetical protein ACRD1V_14610 [Vicinamibacterales bacterium]
MSSATLTFLVIRVLHVLLAAVWVGCTAFAALFLDRLLADTNRAASASILIVLARRRFHVFMASIGGFAVVTGLWLYWRFTGHFDPALSATMGARVFGTGGAAAIIALIIGGAVIGRALRQMTALAERGTTLAEGPERTALLVQVDAARVRIHSAAWIALVLQVVALSLMAIGHYV